MPSRTPCFASVAASLGLALVAGLALAACPNSVDYGDDNDFDGVAELLDCDDDNASVYPGAPEYCDGLDNDCDGEIDETQDLADGETPGTWYLDSDQDGFGDEATAEESCGSPGEGYIQDAGDCDDGDPAVNPDATEDCSDGVDNDCNGEVDDDLDGDGDGVGVCAGDCDDDDPAILPGAEEVCDGVDQDCDEEIDEGFLDGDGDGFLACLDDCNDDDEDVYPGAPELCDGLDNDCDSTVDNADVDGDGAIGCPASGGRIDVVVVVDNSGSMSQEQDNLANQASALFEELTDGAFDFNIMVITTDDPVARSGFITPLLADPQAAFEDAVVAGDQGAGIERPFLMAVEALFVQSLPGGPNEGWKRPGASLAAIILTDEDDQSPGDIGDLNPLLVGLVADHPEFLRVSSITGGLLPCSGFGGSATAAPRVEFVRAVTGGVHTSICEEDWFGDWNGAWKPPSPIDCDDADPLVSPFAVELCDGLDNDCDGQADEDNDGDGFGTCDDCDDTNGAVHPSFDEICDGFDNDCDGQLDGGDEGDADGDGALACVDCDDEDPAVRPGAVELCGDGVDQDCDGEDEPADADLDGDLYSICEGDCDDSDPAVFPLAPEVFIDAIDNDCDGLLDGSDLDQVIVLDALSGVDDSYFVTLGLASGTFSMCGDGFDTLGISSDGFLLPEGAAVFDGTPTAAEFAVLGAAVAFPWVDLDFETGGELVLIERDDSVTVRLQAAPYSPPDATTLTADATFFADGSLLLRHDALELPSAGLLGWTCGADEALPGTLDDLPLASSGDCIDTAGSDGQFVEVSGSEPAGRWTFCPL